MMYASRIIRVNIGNNLIYCQYLPTFEKNYEMSRIDDIIMEFALNRQEFNANDAFKYCLTKEKSTLPYIRKVLMCLVNSGKLIRPSRGVYLKPDKGIFRPQVSRDVMGIYKTLKNKYPFTKICVYEGPWISPLLHHIASNQTIYIEVEKDASEFVFDYLKADGVKAFYKPDQDMVYRYINLDERNVFVKNLVSEAPLQKSEDILVSTLEKMLVDIYCDQDFSYLQGSEYERIAENAMTIFNINKTKLLRYANRRGVKEELEKIYNEL